MREAACIILGFNPSRVSSRDEILVMEVVASMKEEFKKTKDSLDDIPF